MNDSVLRQYDDRLPETFTLLSQAPDAVVQDTFDEACNWIRTLLGRPAEGHERQVTMLAWPCGWPWKRARYGRPWGSVR